MIQQFLTEKSDSKLYHWSSQNSAAKLVASHLWSFPQGTTDIYRH